MAKQLIIKVKMYHRSVACPRCKRIYRGLGREYVNTIVECESCSCEFKVTGY